MIGADAIRSAVRRFIAGEDATVYPGTSAFLGIIPVDRPPSRLDPQALRFWMGPDAYLLYDAVGGRDARFPQDFGWIHPFDALEAVRAV